MEQVGRRREIQEGDEGTRNEEGMDLRNDRERMERNISKKKVNQKKRDDIKNK